MIPSDTAARPGDIPNARLARIREWLRRHQTWLTVGFTVLVLLVAGEAMRKLLHNITKDELLHVFRAITAHQLAQCAALTATSYFLLTFYDVLALRMVGRRVPYPLAAVGSFTAYTLSHNLGFAPVTGAAARARIYGTRGVDAGDIARIVVIAGVTFWLGIGLMLGVALVAEPGVLRVGHRAIAYGWQVALGLAVLAAMAAYMVVTAIRRRPIVVLGWQLPIPSTTQALAQFALAAVDITVASAALLVLVPQATVGDLPSFVAAYVVAMMVALITHAPGGLGVFEVVMAYTLPHVHRPTLLAALLAYRLIYYLVPFAISCLILLANEGLRLRAAARHR